MVIEFDVAKMKSIFKSLGGICSRKTSDDQSRFLQIEISGSRASIRSSGDNSRIEFVTTVKSSANTKFCVYFEDLSRIIANAKTLAMKVSGSSVEVLTGPSKFTIRQCETREFEPFEEIAPHYLIQSDSLASVINIAKTVPELRLIHGSIPSDSIRFDLVNGDCWVWGCSGIMMSRSRVDAIPQGPANVPNSFLVRASLLSPLTNYISDVQGEMAVWSTKSAAHFWSQDFRFQVGQSAGSFPKAMEKIVEKEEYFVTSFFADRQDFISMIRDVTLFGSPVVQFSTGKILVAKSANEEGDSSSKIPIDSRGEVASFKLNGNYLKRILSALDSNEKKILVRYVDDDSPIFFTAENNKFALVGFE